MLVNRSPRNVSSLDRHEPNRIALIKIQAKTKQWLLVLSLSVSALSLYCYSNYLTELAFCCWLGQADCFSMAYKFYLRELFDNVLLFLDGKD